MKDGSEKDSDEEALPDSQSRISRCAASQFRMPRDFFIHLPRSVPWTPIKQEQDLYRRSSCLQLERCLRQRFSITPNLAKLERS